VLDASRTRQNPLLTGKVINGEVTVAPDFYDDAQVLNTACEEWLLKTYEEEVTLQKVTSDRKKFKKHLTAEHELWKSLTESR
jgi:hypothetical protein